MPRKSQGDAGMARKSSRSISSELGITMEEVMAMLDAGAGADLIRRELESRGVSPTPVPGLSEAPTEASGLSDETARSTDDGAGHGEALEAEHNANQEPPAAEPKAYSVGATRPSGLPIPKYGRGAEPWHRAAARVLAKSGKPMTATEIAEALATEVGIKGDRDKTRYILRVVSVVLDRHRNNKVGDFGFLRREDREGRARAWHLEAANVGRAKSGTATRERRVTRRLA